MTLSYPVEPGRPGSARVEYRACKEAVEALLKERIAVLEKAATRQDREEVTAIYTYREDTEERQLSWGTTALQ